ncbi:YncE family protein [Granulicella cerasi]|uniref:YncE family protein n=1 Tax=Granulicella cerasi TaxID=741063 RepID=A0ABW1ZEW2_9BACT|nr:YncE family protein [Granulicella cerasi]
MFVASDRRASFSSAKASAYAAASFAAILLAGCGNTYRPVVAGSGPTGPAGQPTKYAVVLSNTGASASGLATFVDFSGDEVITSPSVQTAPNYLALNSGGSQAYVINAAGSLDTFASSSPNTLLTSDVQQVTLPSTTLPTNVSVMTIKNASASVFVPETGASKVAALNSSGQLLQEITTPALPQYVVGVDAATRLYILNANGTASGVEASSTAGLTTTATLTVGANPVYGVMTSDGYRAFVLNKGSQSISVINVTNNALDSTTPTISIPTVNDSNGNNIASNPVWADINPYTNELVVLSQGDGTHGGMVSIYNIPLCSAAAQSGNSTCNTSNPTDAANFGTLIATVPVGVNPTQVQVLRDTLSPRAYVTNSGNSSTNGSVSVVNLTSGTVTATIPVAADPTIGDTTALGQPYIYGVHPSTLAVTTGTPTGKVYITSTDSKYLTILYTETDVVTYHAPLYGTGVRVVITSP